MKKLTILFLLVFTVGIAFGAEITDDWDSEGLDNDQSKEGLYLEIGYSNYFSKRLDFDHSNILPDAGNTGCYGFSGEIGSFGSPEDNLLDLTELSTLGFLHGRLETNGKYSWNENKITYTATADAVYSDIYLKELAGIQLNLGIFSFGAMGGARLGFNWLEMNTKNVVSGENKYKDNKLYLDGVLQPFVSANIGETVKILISADFSLPVFRARFIKEPDTENYIFHMNWFSNDIPVTYRAGVVIFAD